MHNCNHRAASAPEFIPGEGDPTVTASFSLPAGSCSELLLPPGFPLLQVFADGGARIGFGVNATSFAIKANGGGTVYTDEALELDYLYAFTDGYVLAGDCQTQREITNATVHRPGRINLTNSDNLIESLALFANGASSQFIAGTVDKVEVQQMNGMTKVYVEEVLSNINLVLADGQSSLASKGSSTLTVTGKMNGVSKVTVAAGKCQTANSVRRDSTGWCQPFCPHHAPPNRVLRLAPLVLWTSLRFLCKSRARQIVLRSVMPVC